jgi:hypothetical protein
MSKGSPFNVVQAYLYFNLGTLHAEIKEYGTVECIIWKCL